MDQYLIHIDWYDREDREYMEGYLKQYTEEEAKDCLFIKGGDYLPSGVFENAKRFLSRESAEDFAGSMYDAISYPGMELRDYQIICEKDAPENKRQVVFVINKNITDQKYADIPKTGYKGIPVSYSLVVADRTDVNVGCIRQLKLKEHDILIASSLINIGTDRCRVYELLTELYKNKVRIISLSEKIDTDIPVCRSLMESLDYIIKYETDIQNISERKGEQP